MSTNAITSGTTWSYTGLVVPAEKGSRPQELDDKKLIETRAVQMKDGWVGQIIMAGEIVHETQAYADGDGDRLALEDVNSRILGAFKRLIVGFWDIDNDTPAASTFNQSFPASAG